MRQEEFIEVLDEKGYSYEIEGDKIVVTVLGDVHLNDLTSLPPGVVFKNVRTVYLNLLKTLPQGFVFENRGSVSLESLTSLPLGVEFKNGGYVYLLSLIGGQFNYWEGNIEGIDSNRLLNVMIKQGMFI